MTVRSSELQNGKEVGPRAAPGALAGEYWHVGAIMVVFGVIGWLLGASYSLDGWVIGINLAADWIGLPVTIPAATGWLRGGLILALGLTYSLAEIRGRPVRGAPFMVWIAVAIGLLLIHGTDIGSTFLATITVEPGANPLARWAAVTFWAAVVWAVILTYLPEVLIIVGIALIVGYDVRPTRKGGGHGASGSG